MSVSSQSQSPNTSEKGRGNITRKKGKGKKRENLAHPAQLNPVYHKHDLKDFLSSGFRDQQPAEHAESKASLIVEPFSVCTLPNFVKDDQFLEGLKFELLDQIFYEKNNDLYTFQQSDDLKKISTPHVRALRKLLYEEFLAWLKDVTGVALTDTVDMTCSRYDYTDNLLCHDDELAGRRIAFILYLTPLWKIEDGGMLDLFDMDEHNQPKDVVRSILPQWNQLVWFEVTHASHHQVAEVLTKDKTRVSVGGWFHGPAVPRPKAYIESPLPLKSHGDFEDELHEWMNPIYLNIEVQGQIQERFENDSEIELQGFLKEDKYQEVVKALQDSDIDWSLQGPANKRHFHGASEKSLPEVVQRCIEFFQSEAMFLTLSNLTGLSLHALAAADSSSDSMPEEGSSSTLDVQPSDKEENNVEEYVNEEMDHSGSETEATLEKSKPRKKRRKLNTEGSVSDEAKIGQQKKECNPRCRAEVRKWSPGSYTLVHDTDAEGFQLALDAMLFCCCKGWQPEYGGYTSYIAKGEDEELLTVNPAENSLALVYRDKDTLRFVKYLNDRVKDMGNEQAFYDLSLCYYE